jgi:hypothetical protein
MKVKQYLDCGCAVMEDGHLFRCPTHDEPIPEPSIEEYEAWEAIEEAGQSISDEDSK